MPKISAVIPVYKVESYLARCIDSVLSQSFVDFECILVDDGSPDNCGKICDEYAKKDKRIKVIHKENGGVSLARNIGIDVSEGEWVCFIDSDDWIEKNTLEIIEKYTNNDIYDVICYGLKQFFEKTNKIKNIKLKKTNTFKQFADCPLYMNSPSNKLFRKSLLDGLQFNPSKPYSEDLEFIVNIIVKTKKICYLEYNFYTYYINSQSATNNGLKEEKKVQCLIDTVNNISRYENFEKGFRELINYQKWCVKFRYLTRPSIRDIKKCKETYPEVNNKNFSSMLDFRKTMISLLLFFRLDFLVMFFSKIWYR
ncbi:MAG: glycosyltransferase [Chitinispirillales bacterium]|jgi:glycosyltransferase involved in cell wall biosynthesis|nr:glycosyltransferase [Chitinispirillales bacterium]